MALPFTADVRSAPKPQYLMKCCSTAADFQAPVYSSAGGEFNE